MQNIGFTTVTFRKKSRREICQIACKNNIKYIEWGGDVHLPPQDEKALDEVVELQQKNSITACSYGSYYRLGENNIELWRSVIQTAVAIGAKTVRIWAGNQSSAQTNETLFAELVSETQILADIAAANNLTVAFEFHKGTYNDNGESSLKLLKSVNRNNVKTYWQPMTVSSDNDNLRAVLPYLAGVHIFNWSRSGVRFSLRLGKRRWKRFLRTVAESGQNVPLIMEFVKGDSIKRFEKDVMVLKELVSEIYGE